MVDIKTLVIKGGTLREALPEEFEGKKGEDIELRQYVLKTVDNKYRVVDLDKSEVKPIIRSILGQIGLYPELAILKMSRLMIGGLILIVLFQFVYIGDIAKKGDIEGLKEEIKKQGLTQILTPSIPSDKNKGEEVKVPFEFFGK